MTVSLRSERRLPRLLLCHGLSERLARGGADASVSSIPVVCNERGRAPVFGSKEKSPEASIGMLDEEASAQLVRPLLLLYAIAAACE